MKKEVKKNKIIIDIIVGLIVFVLFFLLYILFAPSKADFFGSWQRDTNEEEILVLGKDGHFSYYDAGAGNPVENYDLCETFSYRKGVIKLHCSSRLAYPNKIIVVSSSSDKLVLKFGDEERTFVHNK